MKRYIQTKAIAKNSFSNGEVPYREIEFDAQIKDLSVDEEIFTLASDTTLRMSQELHDNVQTRGALNESGTYWDDAPLEIMVDPYQYLEVTLISGSSPATYQSEEGVQYQQVLTNGVLQMKVTGITSTSQYATIPPYVLMDNQLYQVSTIQANALNSSTLKAVLIVETDEQTTIQFESGFVVSQGQSITVFCTFNNTEERLKMAIKSANVTTYSIEDLEEKITQLENSLVFMNSDVTFSALEVTTGNIYLDNPQAGIRIKKT